jgi:hypothetical protein
MTIDRTKVAFQSRLMRIPIADICPLKEELTPAQRSQMKYRQIAASVLHIGLVEPLVVFPHGEARYLLVDGHTRLDILKQNGAAEVECLVAADDESYTYNKRVNYLPPIAEHCMILKALTNGVTEARIAEALDVDVAEIRRKRDLLNGICPEAVELLKHHRVTASAFNALRRMKPVRQIKCAELMISANSYSYSFAKAFLQVTPDELLVKPPSEKRSSAVANSTKHLLEEEAQALVEDLRRTQESYAADMFDLATCCRYFSRLLRNDRVRKYLTKHHTDTLAELDQLVVDVEQEKRKPATSELNERRRATG